MNLVLKRIINIIIPVLLAVTAICFLIPFIVAAQNTCDQIVVDEAGVFGSGLSDVEAAANQLISSGADVRVRTIQTYGEAGNLDRYESQLEQQCASWTDSGGNRKNNLVVLIIAIQERQTGLYYGSQWESTLGGRWVQIQTDTINPRLADGDFSGGVTAGLNEINRLITGQPDGQGSTAQGGISAGLIALFVIIFIIALVVGLLLFRSYRKSREKRLAARQKALLAKQGAASKVNQLVDTVQMLEIKVSATAAKVSPEDAVPLIDGLNKAKLLTDQGAQKYSQLGHSAGNPENPKLGEAQLEVIAQEYQKVLAILNQAEEEVNRVETTLDTFQQAIEGFNNKAAGVNTAIESALRKMESAQNSGFKTDHSAGILDQAKQSLMQANSLYQGKRFIQAMQQLDAAANSAEQAARYTDELPEKKQETEEAMAGEIVLESVGARFRVIGKGATVQLIVGVRRRAWNIGAWITDRLDRKMVSAACIRNHGQINLTILFAEKDVRPVVAPMRHMIGQPCNHDACETSHGNRG